MPEALSAVLAQQGIEQAFPIQEKTLPDSLAGRDVLGRGKTGSGKTVAFALPLVSRLAGLTGNGARAARRANRPMVDLLERAAERKRATPAQIALAETLIGLLPETAQDRRPPRSRLVPLVFAPCASHGRAAERATA